MLLQPLRVMALNEGDLLTPTTKQYKPGGEVAFGNWASSVAARSRALQHKLAESWVPSLSLDMIVGSIAPEHHMSTRSKQLSEPLNPELWSSCSGVGRAATLPVAGHFTPAGVWQPPTLPGPALNMYHDTTDKILEMLHPFAETTAHWSQKVSKLQIGPKESPKVFYDRFKWMHGMAEQSVSGSLYQMLVVALGIGIRFRILHFYCFVVSRGRASFLVWNFA